MVRISSVVMLLHEERYDALVHLCQRWTRQSGARWASLCVTENYRRPLSESPSLLASDEHFNKKSMKSQSAKTEREKKGTFYSISIHSSWTWSNEICSLTVPISQHPDQPAMLTRACFPKWLLKVTRQFGISRKELF